MSDISGSWNRSDFPFTYNQKDILYVSLQPWKVNAQSTIDASSSGISKTMIGQPMIFLMPNTFQTTISHTWENVDSLGTRGAQKVNKIGNLGKEVNNLLGDKKGFSSVVTKKYDTPISFKDSNRRIINLTFILMDQGDTKNDVFKPVRMLELYSCAENEKNFDFNLPYIFTIETLNSELIYFENAALTSVQPSYFGPYRDNYPSKCELILEFKDIEPLYRKSFAKRNVAFHGQRG